MRGCEGYVIFAQDGIRWAAWSDEKFGGVWEVGGKFWRGIGRVTMLPILTALNGRLERVKVYCGGPWI